MKKKIFTLFAGSIICLQSTVEANTHLQYTDKIYVQSHQYREDKNGVIVYLNGEKIHVPTVYQDHAGTFLLEREIHLLEKEEEPTIHCCPGVGCDCLKRMPEWGNDRIPLEMR